MQHFFHYMKQEKRTTNLLTIGAKDKVKQSRYRTGVAQRDPGS